MSAATKHPDLVASGAALLSLPFCTENISRLSSRESYEPVAMQTSSQTNIGSLRHRQHEAVRSTMISLSVVSLLFVETHQL
jgi:hypothetical protein